MDKKSNSPELLTKMGIVFISGSAGELDWILPILDDLLAKSFDIKIIFLTRHARISVHKNQMLNDYITNHSLNLDVYTCGGYFFEKIEHFSYLLHRASIKLNFKKKPILKIIYGLINKAIKKFYLMHLPLKSLNLKNKKFLFFSEYPSLRRPRDLWLKEEFDKAIFFYFPHSPHIYAEDLNINYSQPEFKNFGNKYFLLLGHPADYLMINDQRELSDPKLEKVFIGHPKYSDRWLSDLRGESKSFRSSLLSRQSINILVLSRGSGSYLDDQSHANLVKISMKTIDEHFNNYNLFVKKHPREEKSHWDDLASQYPSMNIIDDHIMKIATSVDFVISFWSSGAMDCHTLGIPVIELFDPNKHSKQQVPLGSGFTTIYRLLGIVLPASNSQELVKAISILQRNNYSLLTENPHPFYNELMSLSNDWNEKIEKILTSHNLIKS